ncbi:hypothetical protein B5M06_14955 [Comamonas kerstersii]|uniref:Uncharacterized protein n=1 Tax=Comamonas kerstersii TaxID=225992 RepID=A0A1V0BHF2_9BURK|nr:hypothetical protein [Comamonas kerstersii]AQZ99356.1 hypothetical protein B5M06_14955 [Comamonas kerstersii]
MAFEIEDFTPVKITSVNPRSERHGPEELHPAVDLHISLTTGNNILTALDGKLLDALYTKNANADQGGQRNLEGVEEVSNLPNLKFPLMGALKWKKDLIGYTLTVQHGVGSDIVLTGCKVNNFTIDPKEGGSVDLKFRVQSSDVDERTLGKLGLLVQNEVDVMLLAPEAKQDGQQDIENPLPYSLDEADKQVENPFPSALTPEQALADACAAEAAVH